MAMALFTSVCVFITHASMSMTMVANNSVVINIFSCEFAIKITNGSTIRCDVVNMNSDHSELTTLIVLTSHPKGRAQASNMRTRCVADERNTGARMMRYMSHVCIVSSVKTIRTSTIVTMDMGNV
jgi:hypothetical protein